MKTKISLALVAALALLSMQDNSWARGRGGGGGGGGFRGGGGGGGFRGGGGMSRPSGGMSRPSGGMSRPSGGMSRPSGGMSRPSGGMANRPSGGANRPNIGGGTRPNIGGGSGNRPNFGGGQTANRPNYGGGNRPGNITRPGIGDGNRPGLGGSGGPVQRPGIGDGNRPGIGTRPGQGGGGIQRPGIGDGNRPNFPNRPGDGIATRPSRPGQGGIGEQRPGNRPDWSNNRPNWNNNNRPNWNNNNRPDWNNRPGLRPDNNVNVNNFINNHNNFAVGNGNRWNDWHHGYWGGGAVNHPGYWGYRAGYNHGFWNGYNNASWYRPWYGTAAVWGLGAWALGSAWYDSGYGYYSNPYYVSNVGYYDYSQPIQVVTPPAQVTVVDNSTDTTNVTTTDTSTDTPPPASPEQDASRTHLDKAQDAFMAGNFEEAGRETDLAIQQTPNDTALHEYRALVDFALGDYNRAAGTLYAVLSAGPGWDWTTLSSQYKSVATYTEQLRKLEQHVKDNPNDTAARFVLAYHYITATHKEAAIKQLQQVVEQQPQDKLSAQLIRGLGGEVPNADGAAAPPAAELDSTASDNPPPDIDPAKIIGDFTAKRDDGSTFQLDLTADDKFTWTFERDGKKQSFDGTYKVDGAVLVLQRADNATMPGMVTMKDDGGFNFKLFGGPDSDPGLDFKS